MKKIAIAALIAGVFAFGVFRFVPTEGAATGEGRGGRWFGRNASLNVVVQPVTVEPIRSRLEAIGTSRASKSVTITPRVGGEVTRIAFTAGDMVETGAVLAELDSREERLALDLAKVRLEQAERAYTRRLELTERGTTTVAATDEAKAARDEARIAVQQAQVALDDRIIRAPFAGFVGATDTDVGDRVTTTTEITSLDDRSSLLVRFDVPERFVEQLRLGETVTLETFNGGLQKPTEARIVDIGSRVDQLNRSFVARARINNSEDTYRPGQSFRIALVIDGERYASIPEVSLLWGSDGAYVWQVVDGKAQRTPATVVARRGGRVLVDSTLSPGDMIVGEGVQRVRDGFAITGVDPYGAAPVLRATQQNFRAASVGDSADR